MGEQDAFRQEALLGRADAVAATVQTLQRPRLCRWQPDDFGLIVIDEAHHARARSYLNVLDWFRGYWGLGLTATPDRGDERNIGGVFQTKCHEYPLRAAIREGWLVPIVAQPCAVQIDLKEIRLSGGDYNVGDLESRIGPKIEEIADGIRRDHDGRQTMAFTPDVGSALAMSQVLAQMGVPAEYVAGTGGAYGMAKAERRGKLAAYDRREFRVLVNCDLCVEGYDCPPIACVAIARPTRQRSRYAQMVGRGTRRWDEGGKRDLIVLDFDWQTDESSKDLCATVELFDDGSIDAEVLAVAAGIMREGRVREPERAIEEAEAVIRTRKTLAINLTGKTAQYAKYQFDPVGVGKILDITFRPKYDMDRRGDNPASDAQLGFLRGLGMQVPEGISKWGASKMLDKLQRRRSEGLAGVGQVKELLAAGVLPDLARVLTADQTAEKIRAIDSQRPKNQGSFF